MTKSLSYHKGLPFTEALPWVGFVSVMFLITYLDRAMFGPLLGYIEAEFGMSHSESAALLLYIAIGYAVSTFLSGFTCAWLFPESMVALAIMGCGAVLLCIAVTTNKVLFHTLFFGLGFCAGQYFNAGLSTMRSLVFPKDWGRAISIHELGPNLSFILGPLVVGLGANQYGWRFVVTCMGCLSLFAGLVFLWKGKGGQYAPQPISLKGVHKSIKDPRLWLFAWLFALGVGGEFAPYSVLSLYMEQELFYSQTFTTTLLSSSRILPSVAVLFGGILLARFSTKHILLGCFVVYAAGMFLMALPWLACLALGMFIQPIATAVSFPPVFALLAETFPAEDQPMLVALSVPLASTVGGGLIPKMLGFFGDSSSFSHGFLVLGGMVAVTLLFIALLPTHPIIKQE